MDETLKSYYSESLKLKMIKNSELSGSAVMFKT